MNAGAKARGVVEYFVPDDSPAFQGAIPALAEAILEMARATGRVVYVEEHGERRRVGVMTARTRDGEMLAPVSAEPLVLTPEQFERLRTRGVR